jgi:phosphoribosylaminoimidazole-succinocarboxamide synthase
VPTTLLQSDLPGLELIHRGKVRDVYALPGERLLIVATDRLSAFDVVLPDPIPGKGEMLTQISNFWFGKTAHIVPNHLLDVPLAEVLPPGTDLKLYEKRAVVARRLKPVPVEAIARGYLIGSGWKDYQATGALCGIRLPAGLRQAEQLPEPIFTPSTKAAVGDHDENVSFDAVWTPSASSWRARCATPRWRSTAGPPPTPPSAASSSPTPSSSSAPTRTAGST